MNPKDAFAKIKADANLAAQYKQNPQKVLADLGVDTSKLKKTDGAKSGELSDSDLEKVAGGGWSVGEIICYSWD